MSHCSDLTGQSFARPRSGTTGDGYRLLERHGHGLHTPYAALTPLLGTHPGGAQLSGISLYEAELAAVPSSSSGSSGGGSSKKKGGRAKAQRTAMLFTHRGYRWALDGGICLCLGGCADLCEQEPVTQASAAELCSPLFLPQPTMLVISLPFAAGQPFWT